MKVNKPEEFAVNNILIVDDNESNLRLLSQILTKAGYVIQEAGSGELALKMIETKLPSIVLLDVRMPLIDGYEVCRILKANEKTRDIPVIFISAFDDGQSILTGFEVGGVDFITKPFRKEEILARVKTHISLFNFQLNLKVQNLKLEEEILTRKQAELATEKRLVALTNPMQNQVDIDISGLFDIAELQQLQDQFANAFGVASIITQPDGTPVTRPSNFSRLCQNIIRCTEKGLLNCMHSDAVIGRHNPEGPIVQPCLSGGLWDAGASITVGGQHVANWLIGQVRDKVQEEGRLEEYAREIGADETDFMKAFHEIPSMSHEQFRKIAEMLFTMAGQLSDMAFHNVQQARFIYDRQQAEMALLESEERFRTTLYSIGDGVITTDNEGRIRLMNQLAEQLTGWTQTESVGKPLEEVFRIINEETRTSVEIPVRRVLREGVVVGLANHTLLIAKDGRELPIADSGAPIRNENGDIVGVVLVFRDQTDEREAERALRESEEKFRSIIESSPIGKYIYRLEENGELIFMGANPSADRIIGIDHHTLIGKTIQQAFPNLAETGVPEMYVRVAKGELGTQSFEIEYSEKQINGFFQVTVFRIGNNSIAVDFLDISDRKKTEIALRENEEKFRSLFENGTVGTSMTRIDGTMTINARMHEMLGYTEAEFRNKKWQEITHPEDIQKSEDVINTMVKRQARQLRFEKRYLHKNGNIIWTDVSTTLHYDENDQPDFFITSISDITERKQFEQALFDSEEMMRNSQAVAHICSYSTTLNEKEIGKSTWVCSPEFYKLFGIDKTYPHTIEGWAGLIHPDYLEEMVAYHEQVINERIPFEHEYKIIRINDGAERWVYGTGQLEFDEKGKPIRMHGAIQDITERKMNLEAIQNERKLLRTLIDNLPVSIYVKDTQCRKVVSNLTDVEKMGYTFEKDVLGKTDLELFDEDFGERGYRDDLAVIQNGEPVINREESFKDPKDNIRWTLTSKLPIFDHQGKVSGLVGIGRDITEQKKASETILKLTKSIEQNPSSIVITDLNGNIEYVNPKFTEITGYTFEEAKGQNPRILKSGEMTPEGYKNLWDTISSGEVWRGEFHNRKKNGELYWEWATMTSIKNEHGEITNYIAIKEDISLRKQMEVDLVVAKEKAEESDRLKSAFLANMSHEIRTPLNSIIGFSELLDDDDFDEVLKKEFKHHIISNGNNLLNIISDIVDISKIESGEITIRKSKIQVFQFLDEIRALHLINVEGKNLLLNLTCDESVDETDCSVFADKERLQQIFNNLISNALKFTSEGYIEMGFRQVGDMVEFHVKDTGIGIPADYHQKVFDRFRQVEASNTRKYGGNGLGLAISKNLIELMRGKIWVESKLGKGATFYFTLPLSK